AYKADHVTMLADLLVHASMLRAAGRIPGAITAAKRALALVDKSRPGDVRTRVLAEQTLAELSGMSGDRNAMYEHYETALAAAEGSLTAERQALAALTSRRGLR